jgi:hypothetical protein
MRRKTRICNFLASARMRDRGVSSEVKLWRAVLCQAAEDALIISKKSKKQRARRQAVNWFVNEGEKVRVVCDLAGVRVKTVKHLVDKFLH